MPKNKILERRKQYSKENKKKVRARDKARKIKIPKNKMCEICKMEKATQKHHEDYNKPLEVMFDRGMERKW
jgi:hypothetical protein